MRIAVVAGIVGVGLLGANIVQAQPSPLFGAGGTIVGSVESLGVTNDDRQVLLYINDSEEQIYVSIHGEDGTEVVQVQDGEDLITTTQLNADPGDVLSLEVTDQFGGSIGNSRSSIEMYDVGVDLPDLRLLGGNDGPVYQTLIGSNTGLIEGNDTDIAANTTAIEGNDTDIAANTTAIEGNDTDIAANTTAIEGNDTDIAANTTAIQLNRSAVNANTTSLTANSAEHTTNC